MILSESLLNELLDEFNDKKHLPYVIGKSLPILFFGDIESFARFVRINAAVKFVEINKIMDDCHDFDLLTTSFAPPLIRK